jgi:hypothetical protein
MVKTKNFIMRKINIFFSVLSFKEELILSLTDGWLHRLTWSGNVLPELSFNIRTFCHEPQHPSPTGLYENIDSLTKFTTGHL